MTVPRVPAAFFDLDKTIIAGSSVLALGRPFHRAGLVSTRTLVRTAYARCVFRFVGADHRRMERMRSELAGLVRGWNIARLRQIVAEAVPEVIMPRVYAEAAALIDHHRAAGHEIVLVTSSGTDIVGPIADLLGVDHIIATRMQAADGCYTGEIDFYAYAETKACAVRDLAERAGHDLAESSAYSDSITDLPMLETVGRPHAVNPDRGLRRVAVEREWPILEFARPARSSRSNRPARSSRPSRSSRHDRQDRSSPRALESQRDRVH